MHTLDIEIHPSKQFIFLIGALLLGSVGAVLTLTISPWIKFVLLILILIYGSFILFIHGCLRHKKSIVKLFITPSGWFIQDRIGSYAAELCGSSTVTRIVCVLRFNIPGEKRKRSSVLWRDSVEGDLYRKILTTT